MKLKTRYSKKDMEEYVWPAHGVPCWINSEDMKGSIGVANSRIQCQMREENPILADRKVKEMEDGLRDDKALFLEAKLEQLESEIRMRKKLIEVEERNPGTLDRLRELMN